MAVIRTGLVTNMTPLAQLMGFQLTPYMLSNPTAPYLEVVGADETTYDIAMQRGGDSTMVVVRAYVATLIDQGAQIILDKLLASSGDTSVKQAIESDTSLGGAVDDLRVTRCTGYRIYRPESGPLLGSQWYVQVETSH